ncbi:MAG: porin [Desulfobacteraceae bacterium]|jgi:hypothetical protein
MKKLLVVLMVLALAAPAAMADDTLDLSGAMRARAFDKTNHNFDTDTDTDHRQYWDQRFRVQGTITPSEGVQGVFRLDMAENVWGSDDMDDLDSNQDPGGVDVDRAYLVATKGPVTVVAGLQYLGLGNAVAYDAVHTGLAFVIKTPLVITAGWAKVDEDQTDVGDTTDEEGFEDIDHYFINLGYSAKAFSVNGFYAFQTDGADGTAANPNVEANAIGVQGKFAVGPVNFNVELNIFGGEIDDGTSTVDLVGTQLFGDVNMAMSDALTLGLNFVYSMGTDEDNEVKLTCLTDDGSTVFADYGSMNTLGISPLGRNDIFDDGNGTGTLGGILYTKFQVIPDLTLFGSVGYVTAETELDMTGELDSLMLVNLSAKYTLVPNAHISLHYGYFDLTRADDVDSDTATTLGARLQIDF